MRTEDYKIRTEEDKIIIAYEASTNTYTLTGRHIGYITFSLNTSNEIPCGTVTLTSTLTIGSVHRRTAEMVPAIKDILAMSPRVTDRSW